MKKRILFLTGVLLLLPSLALGADTLSSDNGAPISQKKGRSKFANFRKSVTKIPQSIRCKKAITFSLNGRKCSNPKIYAAVAKACGDHNVPAKCLSEYDRGSEGFRVDKNHKDLQKISAGHDPEQGALTPTQRWQQNQSRKNDPEQQPWSQR